MEIKSLDLDRVLASEFRQRRFGGRRTSLGYVDWANRLNLFPKKHHIRRRIDSKLSRCYLLRQVTTGRLRTFPYLGGDFTRRCTIGFSTIGPTVTRVRKICHRANERCKRVDAAVYQWKICRMYRGEYMHWQVVYPVWALVCRRCASVAYTCPFVAEGEGAASDSDLLESTASDILSDSFTYRRQCWKTQQTSAPRSRGGSTETAELGS